MSTPSSLSVPRSTSWRRAVVLAVIMGCQLMMVLDTSIVTTALPHIRTELGFTPATLSWVQNGYVLAFGGLLLLGARAGDLLGRRRTFMVGVAVFTVASLAAGLAPQAGIMIIARALQGVATALAIPSTLALLVMTFPEPAERTRAIAIYSAVIGAGASVGIIVGGVFTDLLSWRWGLLVNVPIGVAVLLLAPRFLPVTPRQRGSFDLLGALTVTGGMTMLVYGFIHADERGWDDAATIGLFALSAVLMVAFVTVERRARQPITPLGLFRSTQRSGAYAGRILIVGAMFSTFYFLSQYLQGVLGFTALETGFAFIPITIMFFAMVYVVPPLTRLLGKPLTLVASLAVALAGMFWLGRISSTTEYFPDVVLPLLVLGVGQGIAIIVLTDLGMADVDSADAGAASGLVNTAHQIGGSVGLAILTVVFGSAAGKEATQVDGFSAVFDAATLFYGLALVLAVLMTAAARRPKKWSQNARVGP